MKRPDWRAIWRGMGCFVNLAVHRVNRAVRLLIPRSAILERPRTRAICIGTARTANCSTVLIAEEVDSISPEMVGDDPEGQIDSVHYERVNAMLLNEVQKQHRLSVGSKTGQFEKQQK